MMEMKVKDFDDFRHPSRKPWLVVVLIALAAFFVIQRYRGRREAEYIPEEPEETRESSFVPPRMSVAGKTIALEPEAVTPSIDPDQLLAEGQAFEARGALVEARRKYLDVLKLSATKTKIRTEAERRLARINIELVLTPRSMPEKNEYVVKKGDSVEKIARKFGSTIELIQKSNQIKNPNRIRAGDRLRVLTGKFSITISKARNDLLLYMNDEFFKRYAVGTGKYDKTPGGTFMITDKIMEPVWWRPDGKEIPYGDPENILGTRWMTLRVTGDTPDLRGYGIHGTWDEKTVGKSESAGCIRLTNRDVEQICTLVPLGTPVTITDK